MPKLILSRLNCARALCWPIVLALFLLLSACQTAPQASSPTQLLQWDGMQLPLRIELPPTPPRDLWARLRQGYALEIADQNSNIVLAARVATHVRWYKDHPAHIQRMFMRGSIYLFDIVQTLEQEHMPLELALLPAVESAFQSDICSHAAACGLWQFITPTARRFDLKQHMFVDERRHIRASTVAALRYLKFLQQRFGGDWLLALAAYNCGEGCIEKAVRKAQAKGLAGRFEELELVNETTQYVPRLLALAQIVANPDAHGMVLPDIKNTPYFVAVPITRDIDVALAARFAGISKADFLALNSQHNKPLIVAASNPDVFVPVALAERFAQGINQHTQPWSSWTAVQVSATTSVEAIAFLHEAESEIIRVVNAIAPKRLVQAGSTLLVPRTAGAALDIPAQMIESATLVTIPLPVETPPAKRQARGAVAARKPAKQHQAQKSKSAARRVV